MKSVFQNVIENIISLPDRWGRFGISTDEETILCREEKTAELIADILSAAEEDICTGYYDPKEDEQDGCADSYTGLYYISCN